MSVVLKRNVDMRMTEGGKNGVALLVGAGDAIGAAVARRFAAGGYRVCVARRDAEKSRSVVEEIAGSGGVARAVGADVRNEEAVQALFAQVEGELGPVEICLFNAGANVKAPLIETSGRLFFKAWELACYGGFLIGREAARYMVPRGRGTILFTGATASVRGGSGFAAFAAAKFGLRALAQSMARELAPKNIHVAHLIIDGAIDSEAIHRRLGAATGAMPDRPPDSLIETRSVAEAYWTLHNQSRDGWTHELDLRPYVERW
jgi:NAD(P)-dependent dehydrogenase (short-subunit alcohol dehydrogenase family)